MSGGIAGAGAGLSRGFGDRDLQQAMMAANIVLLISIASYVRAARRLPHEIEAARADAKDGRLATG